jgi:hypothetical protein
VVSTTSFLYDDGKKLTGTGTLASKSRLTDQLVRENVFSNAFRRAERKTRRGLLLLGERREEESVWTTLLDSGLSSGSIDTRL